MAESFYSQTLKSTKRLQKHMDTVRRESIIALFDMAVFRTPVDTGRARGNWICTLNEPSRGSMENSDETTSLNEIRSVVANSKVTDAVWLSNNLEYISALEYGWSAQAPNGMMRLSAALWPDIVRTVARKYK